MNPTLIIDIVYVLVVILVCLKIIYDTESAARTQAYLLMAIFIPVAGMLFYFFFGVNYRKRRKYNKKLQADEERLQRLNRHILQDSARNLRVHAREVGDGAGLVHMLLNESYSPLTFGNTVKLLINGEEKFPEVIRAIEAARHHIHLEYYIYEDDAIGNVIKDLLIRKAQEGVEVRLIYDDFGSHSIRRRVVKELTRAGAQAYPFHHIRLWFLANRLNYRNHRKIIIIDGKCGFVGGINISDRYMNPTPDAAGPYWRDTHIRIDGPGIMYLQHIFLCDWSYCSGQPVHPETGYFNQAEFRPENTGVQIAACGPDSPVATIQLSFLKAISLARHEILITTPYFIPGETIMDALRVAALGGIRVMLLVPDKSDSKLVNAAACSNYTDLLDCGVEIHRYHKGFIHSKTMVVDGSISMVGTANMDYRSFELNFEVNAIVYSAAFAGTLRETFFRDLQDARPIDPAEWERRPLIRRLPERVARLLSPLL
jgi:cardiolipin synthase A/B